MNKSMYGLIDIKKNVEPDGTLYVTELNAGLPFDVKRVFWIKNVDPSSSRGNHATKKTKIILVPVSGNCKIEVDTGNHKEVFELKDSSKGLYIDEMIWRSMYDFSADCVLLALCDRTYDLENETFEVYEEFMRAVKL